MLSRGSGGSLAPDQVSGVGIDLPGQRALADAEAVKAKKQSRKLDDKLKETIRAEVREELRREKEGETFILPPI